MLIKRDIVGYQNDFWTEKDVALSIVVCSHCQLQLHNYLSSDEITIENTVQDKCGPSGAYMRH